MKKIRLTAFILSLASCLFLFSAGFSTWFKVVLPTGIDPATGQFTAYSVVDVASSGSVESNFFYTSFGFVDANGNASTEGSISVTHKFASTQQPVKATFGYKNLSNYANTNFSGLFAKILSNSSNTITVTFSEEVKINGTNTKTINISAANLSASTEGTNYDEIFYVFTPNSTNDITITYTFYIPTGEGLEGNFRQNLGKYLMAFDDNKTAFISTVVAGS